MCASDNDVKGAAVKILDYCRSIEENPQMALSVMRNVMGIKAEAHAMLSRESCGYETKGLRP